MATVILRLGKWTAGLLGGLAVCSLLAYAALIVAGFRPAVVYSGSMEPTLHVGSVAFLRAVPATQVEVGDIITFTDPQAPNRLVTHRVIRIVDRPQGRAYKTRGDANPAADPWAVSLPGEVGRFSFDVPYLGYGLVYLTTREVRLALLLATCALVLVGLLRAIWRPEQPAPAQS